MRHRIAALITSGESTFLLPCFPPFCPLTTMITIANYPPCALLHSRNAVCIGCNATRPANGPPSPTTHYGPQSPASFNRVASPRFASRGPSSPAHALSPSATHGAFPTPYGVEQLLAAPASSLAKASQSTHHLLTPSGRDLARGGRVQNVSADPLLPCVIFWPDNEALPEPGQIRPAILTQIPVRTSFGYSSLIPILFCSNPQS